MYKSDFLLLCPCRISHFSVWLTCFMLWRLRVRNSVLTDICVAFLVVLQANTQTEPWHMSRQLHIIYNPLFKGTTRNDAENCQNPCLVVGKYRVEICFRRLDALTVVLRSQLRPTWEILWSHDFVLLVFKFLCY